MGKTATGGHPELKMVNPGAAAIDNGTTMHMAAVNAASPFAPSAHSRTICMTGSDPAASPACLWNPPGFTGYPRSRSSSKMALM